MMRNEKLEYPVISYAVPVDSVEKLTGIDFFPALDDALEDRIEAMSAQQILIIWRILIIISLISRCVFKPDTTLSTSLPSFKSTRAIGAFKKYNRPSLR